MDLDPYITFNRTALLRMIAIVFRSVGLEGGNRPQTLTRLMRSKALMILRPAESALRRLIFVLALELERNGYELPKWVKRAAPDIPIETGEQKRSRAPLFRLNDPRQWFWWIGTKSRPRAKYMPRITFIGYDDDDRPAPSQPESAPTDDDPMDAAILCDRLLALKLALDDLPKQAKRMLRLRARKERANCLRSALRPGSPPGYRRERRDEVHEILHACHQMALRAMKEHDTS